MERARAEMSQEAINRRQETVPCEYLHSGWCNVRYMQLFCVVFFKSIRVYGPIHLIPLILSPSLVTNRSVCSALNRQE